MQSETIPARAFTTDVLPERERYDAFRDEMARQVMRLDVRRAVGSAFYSSFHFAGLGEAGCGAFDFSPAAYGRTPELIADGNDDFVLLINRSAPLHEDRGDSVTLAGGALLQNNSRAAYIETNDTGSLWNVVIPRKALLAVAPGAEDMVGQTFDAGSMPLRLLRAYVSTLLDDNAIAPLTLATAAQHLTELTALVLSVGGAPVDIRATAKAARTVALQRAIRTRLSQPGLTLGAIAKAQGISERYVQRLMQDQGTSFTDYVLDQRLSLAYHALASPLHRHRRISDIAYSVGFSDLSHFNRSFRRRFGASPRDLRRAALMQG